MKSKEKKLSNFMDMHFSEIKLDSDLESKHLS